MSLRELLIKIAVKADAAPIKAIDSSVVQATRNVGQLERALNKIGAAAQRATKGSAFEMFSGLPAARNRSYLAPPRRGSLAPPDLALFAPPDERTKLEKTLDAVRDKFKTTFAGLAADGEKTKNALLTSTTSIRYAFTGLAVVVAATAIGRFLNDVVQTGKELYEASQRVRVSVETLQTFGQLAVSAGVDTDVLERAFRKLAKSTRQATKAGSPAAKAFKDLGVTAIDPTTKKMRAIEDIMVDVGTALAGADDDTKALAIATQLLGPAGQALVPAFRNGKEAVQAFLAEARTNVVINEEQAKVLKHIGDEVTRGSQKWKALKQLFVGSLAPALDKLAGYFERTSKWLLESSKHTKIFQAVLTVLAGNGLFKLVGLLASWVAKTGGIKAALEVLSGGLRSVMGFALRTVLPLLALEDFMVFMAGGKSLFGRAMNEMFGEGGAKMAREKFLAFSQKLKEALSALGGIASAFAHSEIFTGLAKGVLDGLLDTLNLIGSTLTDNTEKAEKMKRAVIERSAPNPDSPFSKTPEFADKINPFGDIEDKSSWFQRFRKGAQNLFSPTRDLAHERISEAILPGSTAPSYAPLNFSPVPYQPTAPMSSNLQSSKVEINDHRSVEINVDGGNGSPGQIGRAVSGEVNELLKQDPRQTLMSISG